MSNTLKFTGVITEVLDVKSGESANGEWKALEFLVVENKEDYPQSALFRLFGAEKVDNFLQYNKVGNLVEVSFNLKTNQSKDKKRHFNSLDAWRVYKLKETPSEETPENETGEDNDDLPF